MIDLLPQETNPSQIALPSGHEMLTISCRFTYTVQERQQQERILREIAQEQCQHGRVLKAVQYIKKAFSEHPWLATRTEEAGTWNYDTESLLAASSKFQWL